MARPALAGAAAERVVGEWHALSGHKPRAGHSPVRRGIGQHPVREAAGSGIPHPQLDMPDAPADAVTSNGCAAQLPVSPLPVWARSGFSPADQAMPHVLGGAGNIVAILWASRDAFHSPALQDRSNKILWVSRIPLTGPDPLVISHFAAQ
jgi:hypothetical protein